MPKLVSVIIPCFNAQKWLEEAVVSALVQSYKSVEVIVIDDGSTDHSVDILKRLRAVHGERLRWESGPNRGGSHARNRGFAISKGDYIQFLDADDYIFPNKLARQVKALEEKGSDAVYGDWRYRHHLPDGNSVLGMVKTCGPKTDFLESLLSNDRWLNPAAILFTREAVERSGGWDNGLKAAQDRDFFLSVALTGAKFAYQPGCDSIYREYGRVTVSTSCKRRWLDSHCVVMEKAERRLEEVGQLSSRYRKALAQAYYNMGREYLYSDYPQLDEFKYSRYLIVLDKALTLDPQFKAEDRNPIHRLMQNLFDFRIAEQISYWITRTKLSLRAIAPLRQMQKTM